MEMEGLLKRGVTGWNGTVKESYSPWTLDAWSRRQLSLLAGYHPAGSLQLSSWAIAVKTSFNINAKQNHLRPAMLSCWNTLRYHRSYWEGNDRSMTQGWYVGGCVSIKIINTMLRARAKPRRGPTCLIFKAWLIFKSSQEEGFDTDCAWHSQKNT